ncbi:MAG TPA: secretin N-terminal domain-containing protein [Gammaproteobacteria bacterium]|nr:secretin N-terminal domain-containing protein [Gammaproteobacteria bacterium]
MLVLIFGIGNDAAAQARQGQQDQAAEIERLRRELEQVRQQQQPGQPLLVVPSMQPPPPPPRIDPEQPMVDLLPLLQRVERASGKRFIVDRRLGSRIYLGTVDPDDVTYPALLAILRINGFAAFESEGFVNIVPDANIRFHETRIVQTDDASIPAEEFVTRVLAPKNIQAAMLVPILRPLMPQPAHLAAHSDSNQLILMDRYANVQRITAIVRSLDVPSARQGQ